MGKQQWIKTIRGTLARMLRRSALPSGIGLREAARAYDVEPQLIRYWIKQGKVEVLKAAPGPGLPMIINEETLKVALQSYHPTKNTRSSPVEGDITRAGAGSGGTGLLSTGSWNWKSLPGRRLAVAMAMSLAMAFLVLYPNDVEAVVLTATCNPATSEQGGIVTCNLSLGIQTNEQLPIDKLRVQVGNQKVDFNIAGVVIGTGNSSALTMTSSPQQSAGNGFGYIGQNNQTLFGYGYGYNPNTGNSGFGYLNASPSLGYGYGYGYGYQLLQNLNYTVQINTTSFTPGSFEVDFRAFVIGDSNLEYFHNEVDPTFTVVESVGAAVSDVAQTGTVDEILETLADLLPDQAAATLDRIGDPTKRAEVVKNLAPDKIADVAKKMNTNKLAEVFEELGDDAKDVIEKLAGDDEGTTKAAETLKKVAEKAPEKAANAISKVESKAAAKVMDKVKKEEAGAILDKLSKEKRQDVVLNMDPNSLKDRLAEVSPSALTEMDADKLMEKLPDVSAEQLSNNKTPVVDESRPAGKVVQSFGNVAIYEIESTGELVWVKLVGSPDPIDQVIARFTENVDNVSIIVNPAGTTKPSTAPALPAGLVANSYFFVTPSVEPELIKSGLIGFFVEKSWLADNGFHKWSIVLQRLNGETNEWQSVPTQRVSEDETRVHYDAPVPGFSLFAVTGGADPATFSFTVADLQISPAIAVEGADVTITASVTNTGTTDETFPINLSVNDVVDDSVSIAVAAGATETIMFTTTQTLGTYEVRVDRLFGNFIVEGQQVATPTPQPTVVPPQPTATSAPPAPTATSAPAPAATATRAPAPAATATSAPAPAPTTAPSVPAAPATIAPALPAPTAGAIVAPADDDDDGGNLGLIIGIIVVILLLGGGIAFFALRSRQPGV